MLKPKQNTKRGITRKKKLVKDMTEPEHRAAKRKWKTANKKRRERQKTAQKIMDITPDSTPRSGTPVCPSSRGRRQIRRDRSALYRKNLKLKEELKKLTRKCNKYKKRYQRAKYSQQNKYSILSNAIKDHYKSLKTVKEKIALKRFFQGDALSKSKMKTAIVRETLGIDQMKQKQTTDCMSPKIYQPVPVTVFDTNREKNYPNELNEEEALADISNIVAAHRRTYYNTVYSSSSSSDDESIANFVQPSVSNIKEKLLIEKENVHPLKISDGVHVLVKFSSVKDKYYTYLGVAKCEVDEKGEVKIMFYKTVDSTGKRFKAVETDVSYEPYNNILEIVPNPKTIVKGKRVYFGFDKPLNVFEK